MIAYWGLLPRAERAQLVRRMTAIRAQRDAGTLDKTSFYVEALDLDRRLSTAAVGVFLTQPH